MLKIISLVSLFWAVACFTVMVFDYFLTNKGIDADNVIPLVMRLWLYLLLLSSGLVVFVITTTLKMIV